MARHVASIVCLSSTAMALLCEPWDAFAALSLLLARKLAATSASAALSMGRSVSRTRRVAPLFKLLLITVAVANLSPRTRPRGTVFACERVLVKTSRPLSPLGSLLQTIALALVVQTASPPRSLSSKASAQSHVA